MFVKRVDGFQQYNVTLKALHVIDPSQEAAYYDPISPLKNQEFFKVSIIKKGLAFEKFSVHMSGLKIKLDERFIIDLAYFTQGTILSAYGKSQFFVKGSDIDSSDIIASIIERGDVLPRDLATSASTSSTSHTASLIFFNYLFVSGFEVRFWYHQAKKKYNLVNFGIFSKFDIRMENSPILFSRLSLRKPYGSWNLYQSLIFDHYYEQAFAQIKRLLFSSIDYWVAPMKVADTLYTKIMGSEIKSTDYHGESLNNEEIVERYRRKLFATKSLDSFLKDVVKNCVFDWSYNHTGLFNVSRALVIGVVNRSIHEIGIQGSLARGRTFYILPGGLTARQVGNDAVKIAPGSSHTWDSSSTCLILAHGFLTDVVELTLNSNAFRAHFTHTEAILHSKPGFSAAFLAKDVSKWLSWYVLMVENNIS